MQQAEFEAELKFAGFTDRFGAASARLSCMVLVRGHIAPACQQSRD
jgi:hypothetical protein